MPHENFNRDIGAFKKINCTVDGEVFEGDDAAYAVYLQSILPTAEDEENLKELFKQDWVANKPMSARQIASGIGAKA